MPDRPYTTLLEFEQWVREERKRVVVEQNAERIRMIQDEELLGRIKWAPTTGSLSANSALGFILKPYPFSPLEWEDQVMRGLATDRLLLPVEGTTEHMTLRTENGSPSLHIPNAVLEAAAKQYALQVHFATWSREIADIQGRVDVYRTRRAHMIQRLGGAHVASDGDFDDAA